MQLKLPWEIIKIVQNNPRLTRALRAFGILTASTPRGRHITRADIVAIYDYLGLSKSTADRDIRELLAPIVHRGFRSAFVTVDGARIRARAVDRICEDLGLTRIGWCMFTEETIVSLQTFKEITSLDVAFASRNSRGVVHISRAAISGMAGGITPPTQRRRERKHGVVQTRCYAKVEPHYIGGKGVDKENTKEYWERFWGRNRPKLGARVIEIRSEFRSPRPGVAQMHTKVRANGKPAQHIKLLEPEYGVQSMRQSFNKGDFDSHEAQLTLCDITMTGADVDVFQEYVPTETGEIIGMYERLLGDTEYAGTAKQTRSYTAARYRKMAEGVAMR